MVVRFLVGFLVRFPALAGSFGVGPRLIRVAAWGQVCPLVGGGSGRACTCRAGSRWPEGRPTMGGGRRCSGLAVGPSWCARAAAKRWSWARCGSWGRCETARGARDRAAAGRAVGGRGDGGALASAPPPLRRRARGRRGGGLRGVACRRGYRGAAVVSGAGGQGLGRGGARSPGAPRSWPARLPMGCGVGLLPVGRGVGVVGGASRAVLHARRGVWGLAPGRRLARGGPDARRAVGVPLQSQGGQGRGCSGPEDAVGAVLGA